MLLTHVFETCTGYTCRADARNAAVSRLAIAALLLLGYDAQFFCCMPGEKPHVLRGVRCCAVCCGVLDVQIEQQSLQDLPVGGGNDGGRPNGWEQEFVMGQDLLGQSAETRLIWLVSAKFCDHS